MQKWYQNSLIQNKQPTISNIENQDKYLRLATMHIKNIEIYKLRRKSGF